VAATKLLVPVFVPDAAVQVPTDPVLAIFPFAPALVDFFHE